MLSATPEKMILCPNPNCGRRGLAIAKPKGNPAVLIGLLACGILPGILYALFASGYTYECPACGARVGADLMR